MSLNRRLHRKALLWSQIPAGDEEARQRASAALAFARRIGQPPTDLRAAKKVLPSTSRRFE